MQISKEEHPELYATMLKAMKIDFRKVQKLAISPYDWEMAYSQLKEILAPEPVLAREGAPMPNFLLKEVAVYPGVETNNGSKAE